MYFYGPYIFITRMGVLMSKLATGKERRGCYFSGLDSGDVRLRLGLGWGWILPFCVCSRQSLFSTSLHCTTTTAVITLHLCTGFLILAKTCILLFFSFCMLRFILHGAGLRASCNSQYDSKENDDLLIYFVCTYMVRN